MSEHTSNPRSIAYEVFIFQPGRNQLELGGFKVRRVPEVPEVAKGGGWEFANQKGRLGTGSGNSIRVESPPRNLNKPLSRLGDVRQSDKTLSNHVSNQSKVISSIKGQKILRVGRLEEVHLKPGTNAIIACSKELTVADRNTLKRSNITPEKSNQSVITLEQSDQSVQNWNFYHLRDLTRQSIDETSLRRRKTPMPMFTSKDEPQIIRDLHRQNKPSTDIDPKTLVDSYNAQTGGPEKAELGQYLYRHFDFPDDRPPYGVKKLTTPEVQTIASAIKRLSFEGTSPQQRLSVDGLEITLGRRLGQGGEAKVYDLQVIEGDDVYEPLALRIVAAPTSRPRRARQRGNEIEKWKAGQKIEHGMLESLSGKSHMPRIYHTELTDQSSFVLMEKLTPFSHQKIEFDGLASQLLEANKVMHREGVYHRDLKPSNIMFDRFGRIKVVDFGMALRTSDPSFARSGIDAEVDSGQVGVTTPYYVAPETASLLQGQALGGSHKTADLYATSLVLFEKRYLAGKPISQLETKPDLNAFAWIFQSAQGGISEALRKKIKTYATERGTTLSAYDDFMLSALEHQPNKRFTAEEMEDALVHLKGGDYYVWKEQKLKQLGSSDGGDKWRPYDISELP